MHPRAGNRHRFPGFSHAACVLSRRVVRLTARVPCTAYDSGVATVFDRYSGLSEREARILDFERTAPTHRGSKERAIRSEFQFSAARYYQLLNSVIDSPVAYALDPLLVGRLRRARGLRTSQFTAESGGDDTR